MPTLAEYEVAFEADPAATQAFLALRKAYRERRQFDKLVTLYEQRAVALPEDAKAAELFYLAAEVRLDHLSDAGGAETDLNYALDRYPAHVKAAERLKLLYREQGRTADYMTMLELEAGAVVQSGDAQRRARLQQEMAQLFSDHIARIETALGTPQRAREVGEDDLRTVESARKIYRALGDFAAVVRLYELQLRAVTDGGKRADLLLACARVLSERTGDQQAAVAQLGEVLRLRPNDERAMEMLAAIYMRPDWDGEGGKERAAGLLFQNARRRHEAGDIDGAIGLLRKALAASAGHTESGALLERILYENGRLQELDRHYRERASAASDRAAKMDFLFKRAQLAERDLNDAAEALRVYEEIVEIEPTGGPASQHLAKLYSSRQNYAKLADLREKQLGAVAEPAERLPLLRELAALYKDRLGDAEQAAVYVHAILQIDPGDAGAQQAYSDHFRRKGDWKSLIGLLEYSLAHDQQQGVSPERLLARLEEIAILAERQLGDSTQALRAWHRIEQMAPGNERAREAQKRLLLKDKDWAGMAQVLEREVALTADKGKKIDLLKRLAKLHLEKVEDPAKAVHWYRQVLLEDATDAASFRALFELYEGQQRWEDLAGLIRGHLDVAPTAEKVGLLRRLASLYDETLGALGEAAWAARELLTLVPGDRDSFTRLETVLARAGDREGLAVTLEQHISHASGAERPDLLRRTAQLCQEQLGDHARAARHWEALIALAPEDDKALVQLATAYETLNRPAELLRVLEQQADRAADPGTQAGFWRRIAQLARTALQDSERARTAWERLLTLLPTDGEALAAVTEIYRNEGRWRPLADVLGRRVALVGDTAQAVSLALERAQVVLDKLEQPGEAVEVLEQVVAELDSRNGAAFAELRRIHESREDWQKVVGVAERQLYLHEDPAVRLAAAFEIGTILRDRLGDPDAAIGAFERALAMAPEDAQTLRALAPLYALAGEAEKLVNTNQKLLAQLADREERCRLMYEIADTCESSLNDPRRAFDWARRVHDESPGDASIDRLEQLAAGHGLWDDLVRVWEGERARAVEPQVQVKAARRIAEICEVRTGNPQRAFAVLRDSLTSEPEAQTLLPELERLARLVKDWGGLLDVYARVARARPSAEDRLALLERRARVREQDMGDATGALDEWLRSFALAPDDERTRGEILRLAERTSRWEDALNVQGQLFARAEAIEDKVEIAKRAAALVEEHLEDRVRAFRAYLNAFRLAPEDPQVLEHLWRLAALIGRYDRGDDGRGTVEVVEVGRSSASPDATIHLDVAALPRSTPPAAAPEESAAREETSELELEELDEGELEELEEVAAEAPPPLPKAPPPPPPARGAAGAQVAQFVSAWEEFAQAYGLLPANDNITQRRYLLRIADIWQRGAGETDRALAALERAFRLDPFDDDVRAELVRIAKDGARWEDICNIWLSVLSTSLSAEEAVRLHHDVARFREDLGQRGEAERRYLAILDLHPDDRVALDQLEGIYREQARWSDLGSLLERRTTSLALELEQKERRDKIIELATLHEDRLERPYEAIDTYVRYLAEIEDEAHATDDPELLAELRDVHAALARLYGRVDRWSKAVESLRQQLDLTSGIEPRRAIALRMAAIFEKELAMPAKAAEAYQSVLADCPGDGDSMAALDHLLEATAQWEALSSLLEKRIALATGADRLALVKRRSRILEERLDNPDAAASNLRALGGDVLEDDDITAALLRNLKRAGLFHEAAKLLGQRIERLEQTSAAPERIVEVWIEIARLRLDDLGDKEAAREALTKALALRPDHVESLRVLAKLHLEDNDFAAYASTRVREAQALDGAAAVPAYLEAGGVYRDQLGDAATARRCFEQALQEVPGHPESLRALSALLSAHGQSAEAQSLIEQQLEMLQEPKARAVALSDLARVMWREPGDSQRVLPLLEQAIELDPDYLPALTTLADLHYKEGDWEQAERRLTQAVRRLRGRGEETAALYHRLADVYEKLGRLDDGFRQLQEADRKNPGQFLVKLAMGSNRFAARKWRESIAHLEGLGEREEAPRYPDETARGLATAALAYLKIKQTENARALFEEALRFVPHHLVARQALADMALEKGDLVMAADHLQTIVEGTLDRRQKAALLERIGDLHGQRGDATQARACFEAAVALIGEPDESQVPLLEKTLELQRAAGAVAEATETSVRLISLIADPAERGRRRREAAETLLEHGQAGRAAELLTLALEDESRDEKALSLLVTAHDRLGRPEGTLFLLERILPELPAIAAKASARARRAALWERLGELRRATDESGAIAALERAAEIEPERVSARVTLADLLGSDKQHAEAAARNHRALAWADVTRDKSVRAVARALAQRGDLDGARCHLEVLEALGLANKSDRGFLKEHPASSQRPDEPYGGAITEAVRAGHLSQPGSRALAEVFATIWEGALEIAIDGPTLESLNVKGEDKISPMSELDVAKIAAEVAKALDAKRTPLYIGWDPKVTHATITIGRPPAVVLPSEVATEASPAELRFRLGRALELARPEYILAAAIEPKAFSYIFGNVLKAFHPRHARRRAGGAEAGGDQAARFKKALPYKVAKRLAEVFAELGNTPFSSAAWRAVVDQTGDRAGLLMCADLAAASRIVLADSLDMSPAEINEAMLRDHAVQPGRLRELLRFSMSEDYLVLRKLLGTGLRAEAA